MTSVLVDTGCVPDWAYAVGLVVIGFIAWRALRTRSRQTAA